MVADSESVTILGTFLDQISRPALTAAASLHELGEEIEKLQKKHEGLETHEAAATAKAPEKVRATNSITEATKKKTREVHRATDAEREHTKQMKSHLAQTRASDRAVQLFTQRLQRMGGVGLGVFGSMFKLFSILSLVVPLLSLAAVAIQGLGAAAVAAVASMGPLLGMIGLLAGILPAIAAGLGFGKLAFGGMMEAWTALNDPNAESAAIDKAMEKLSVNARQFLATTKDIGKEWKGIKNDVQNTFFNGLGDALRPLSANVQPVVRKNLTETAAGMNSVAMNFMQWLSTPEAAALLDKTMQLGTIILVGLATGLAKSLQILMKLAVLATPLISNVTRDVLNLMNRFDAYLDRNGKTVESFFTASWEHFKGWMRVIGDFSMGFYALFKAAAPMVEWMGDAMGRTAKNFRAWAENPEVQKRLTAWFERMIPVVSALLSLIGSLIMAIWRWGDGQEDSFVRFVDFVEQELLPSIDKFVAAFSDTDILISVGKILTAVFGILTQPGVAEAIATIARAIASLVTAFSEWFATLTPEQQKFLITMIVGFAALVPILGQLVPFMLSLAGAGVSLGAIIGVLGAVLLGVVVGLAALYFFVKILVPYVEDLGENFKKLFDQIERKDWIGVWETFKDMAKDTWDFLVEGFPALFSGPDVIFRSLFTSLTSYYEMGKDLLVEIGMMGVDAIGEINARLIDMFSSWPSIMQTIFDAIGMAIGPAAMVIQILWGQVQSIVGGVRGLFLDVGGLGADLINGLGGLFADGGTAPGGLVSLVGERGPEAALGSDGKLNFVGLNGPELIKPSGNLDIVPNEFLNSLSAKDGLKSSSRAQNAVREFAMAGAEKRQAQVSESHDHLHLDGITVRDDADVEKIISQWDRYQKNKKERM